MTGKILRSIKPGFLICIAALVFICGILERPETASAQAVLKIKPGLGGLYKVESPVELQITVQNTGEALKGYLVVDRDPDSWQRQEYIPPENRLQYRREISMKAGESATFHMIIPGDLAASSPRVRLISGQHVIAAGRVEGTAVGGGLLAISLGEGALTSGLPAWLEKTLNGQVTLKYLPPEELPANSLYIGSADLIVVDPSAASKLTGDQAQALREWTAMGGKLLLSGGAGAQEGGPFGEITPVIVSGSTTTGGSLGGLSSLGGSLTVARGTAVSGRVLASTGGLPLLATRQLGRGNVLFSSPDLADMRGDNPKFWSALFGQKNDIKSVPEELLIKARAAQGQNMAEASSYLPQLKLPPVPLLTSLWIVYIVVLCPALYFVLRRKGRQERAWYLVPLISLVAATGFFLMAPTQRLQGYLAQTLASIEILEPGLAEIDAAGTVVVPRGGDVSLESTGSFMVKPLFYRQGSPDEPITVTSTEDKNRIYFNDVEYGSMRQASAYGLWRNSGTIEGKISFDKSNMQGMLKNNTSYDLRDCKILVSGRLIEIGALPAGSTKKVNEHLDNWQLLTSPDSIFNRLNNRTGDKFVRERQMVMEQLNRDGWRNSGILFLGWSDSTLPIFKVEQTKGKGSQHGLLLVKQQLELDFTGNTFTLPPGFVAPQVYDAEGGIEERPDGMLMHGKKASLLFDLANALPGKEFKVTALEIAAQPRDADYLLEIYQWKTSEWVKVPSTGQRLTGEKLEGLVSRDLSVKLRLNRMSPEPGAVPVFPGLGLEGVLVR